MVAHALTLTANDAESWLASLDAVYSDAQRELVQLALDWLADHAAGMQVDTGADLAGHSLGTAAILAGMRFDADTVAAGLLCGLPDIALAKEKLVKVFGPHLTTLVEGSAKLTRMDRLFTELAAEGGQSEALRQMLLAMTDDIRVVLIKLAERTQALRELANVEVAQNVALRRKIAGDVRELYAPLANRLGVWQLKWELEDLSCRYLEPETYRHIAKLLDERRLDREWYIEQVIKQLSEALTADGLQGFTVNGRPKHISSILAKMRKKRLTFDEVYDVRALRVQVRDVKDCFHALGLVHSLWQPIPGQFDDYISRPKGNGYKSLHTAVVGPENKALEVQIRTFEMHQEAELGVAAHWRYKEGGKSQGDGIQEKVAWLRQILAWKQELGEGGGEGHELAQHFRNELFQDEVYVLTPQGKVVALSAGATPLDFAYAVHSELGHRCRGAKVDGNLVPLDTVLKTGQRVEVLTVKQGGPSRDWLNPHLGVLKTSRARAKVRQWFKQQDHDTHVQEGRALLDRELHRLNLTNVNLDKLASRLKFSGLDELCAALGRGDLGSGSLDRALQEEFIPAPEKPLVSAPKRRADAGGVLVEGEPGLLTQMAGCCKPLPPDRIVGYTTQGHGVTIHRADCPVLQHLPEDKKARLLAATWGDQDREVFAVDVEISAQDRSGLLKDVGELFSQEKINVVRVNTLSQEDIARMEFTLEVKDITQLTRFLARAAQVRGVHAVRRK